MPIPAISFLSSEEEDIIRGLQAPLDLYDHEYAAYVQLLASQLFVAIDNENDPIKTIDALLQTLTLVIEQISEDEDDRPKIIDAINKRLFTLAHLPNPEPDHARHVLT